MFVAYPAPLTVTPATRFTVADNLSAFGELGFAPHVAGLSGKRDLATTVMGQSLSMPVMISPTGVQAVHPDGEVAVARADVALSRAKAAGRNRVEMPLDSELAPSEPAREPLVVP